MKNGMFADARDFAIMFLCVGLVVTTLKIFPHVEKLFDEATTDLHTTSGHLNTMLVNVTDAAANARDASLQASLAAKEQRAYWAKTSLETYKTMASLRLTITRTDKSVNDVLVPKLSDMLQSATSLSAGAAENLSTLVQQFRAPLDNMNRATAAAADALSDPHIAQSIAHADEAAASASSAAAHADKSAANIEAGTADIKDWIHRNTTPIRGTWNLVRQFIKDFGGTAASAVAAGRAP